MCGLNRTTQTSCVHQIQVSRAFVRGGMLSPLTRRPRCLVLATESLGAKPCSTTSTTPRSPNRSSTTATTVRCYRRAGQVQCPPLEQRPHSSRRKCHGVSLSCFLRTRPNSSSWDVYVVSLNPTVAQQGSDPRSAGPSCAGPAWAPRSGYQLPSTAPNALPGTGSIQ